MTILGPVAAGDTLRHKGNGRTYKVIMLTNKRSVHPEKFPVTVVYADIRDMDNPYSRSLSTFVCKFERIR